MDASKYFSEKGLWKIVRKHGTKIPFLREMLAMYFCWKDPHVPSWVKPIIVAALGYVILPLDLVADFIPVGGWLDDASIMTAAMAIVSTQLRSEHWERADEAMGRERA